MGRLPNHEERRAFNKRNHTNYQLADFAIMAAVQGLQKGEDINWLKPYIPWDRFPHKDNWALFPNGTKLRLNVNNFLSRPQKDLTEEFKNWVLDHKDVDLTLYRDIEDQGRKGLVSVSEDPRWLFDLYFDMLVWDNDAQTFVDPQNYENRIGLKEEIDKQYATCVNSIDFEDEEAPKGLREELDGLKEKASTTQILTELEGILKRLNEIFDDAPLTMETVEEVLEAAPDTTPEEADNNEDSGESNK